MDKESVTEALSKPQKDITDAELKAILLIPEDYWPTNPYQHTTKGLLAEQKRRADVSKITYQEILNDVLHLTFLRHVSSFGPRIFPEADLLGQDEMVAEIRRLEPIVRKKIIKYKEQK